MSERLKKVNSNLKKVLSKIIQEDLNNTALKGFFYTVTDVSVSPDLHSAHVYVSVLGTTDSSERGFSLLLKQLKKIQHLMSSRIRMKYTPKITLVKDDTINKAARVEALLNQVKKESSENDERISSD